ncbi:MAG: type I-E CRISPR-associated protein Cas6/Cse3/CasE [Candidatus Kapabacteria bacterium]|nr:type I-E CRISPR-associated protein Cas6/Cse3/CasE [Candidatus Kapabacteria bacterium]
MSEHNLGFISRIRLREDVTLADLRKHKILNASDYQLHKLLWNVMSYAPDQKRDFIFRQTSMPDGMPEFLVVSKHQPQSSFGVWDIQCKPYNVNLNNGDVLRYTLRCNPVFTPFDRERIQSKAKSTRYDVIASAKRIEKEKAKKENKSIAINNQQLIYDTLLAWLEKRSLKNGFELDKTSFMVERYHYGQDPKSKDKSLSILDVTGYLNITDTDTFLHTLTHGIGHAKAWGCGLMLVKRG